MNLTDFETLKVPITGISKSEAIKLLQNIDLTEKSGTL